MRDEAVFHEHLDAIGDLIVGRVGRKDGKRDEQGNLGKIGRIGFGVERIENRKLPVLAAESVGLTVRRERLSVRTVKEDSDHALLPTGLIDSEI